MAWFRMAPRIATREVLALGERGLLDADGLDAALRLAGRVPDEAGWGREVERLLAGIAIALFAAGVICVVAYNWAAIGRWGRFAGAQALVVAVVAAALWRGLGTLAGKALLTLAIALIGPMLALFGQTYQTGADVFELFKGWALLALPWALASRFAPAWLLWLGIVEVAIGLYLGTFELWLFFWFGFVPTWAGAALFSAALLVVWEVAAHRFEWLAGRTGPRTIAAQLLVLLTLVTGAAVWGFGGRDMIAGALMWLAVIGAGTWAYRHRGVEVGMLALGWLSVTVVALAVLARLLHLAHAEVLGLWIGAAALIGLSAWGRTWLGDAAKDARARSESGSAGGGAAPAIDETTQ